MAPIVSAKMNFIIKKLRREDNVFVIFLALFLNSAIAVQVPLAASAQTTASATSTCGSPVWILDASGKYVLVCQ